MTGFDSESDRRDAIRHQIVNECVALVDASIDKHAPTGSLEERTYLLAAVMQRLHERVLGEARLGMMRREILDAEAEIDAAP